MSLSTYKFTDNLSDYSKHLTDKTTFHTKRKLLKCMETYNKAKLIITEWKKFLEKMKH